jgi:hypothetical protein
LELAQFTLFGPDFNWIFDLRNDLDGQMEDALADALEDGDSVVLITLSQEAKQRLAIQV